MATMTQVITRPRTQVQVQTAADMLDQYVRNVEAGRLTQDQKIQALTQMVLRAIEEGDAANRIRAFAVERISRLEEEVTAQKIAIVVAGAALGGLIGGGVGLGIGLTTASATTTTILTSTAFGVGGGVLVGTGSGMGVNCYRGTARHAANLEHLRRTAQGGV